MMLVSRGMMRQKWVERVERITPYFLLSKISIKNINFVEEFRNFRAIATLYAALIFLHQIIL